MVNSYLGPKVIMMIKMVSSSSISRYNSSSCSSSSSLSLTSDETLFSDKRPVHVSHDTDCADDFLQCNLTRFITPKQTLLFWNLL